MLEAVANHPQKEAPLVRLVDDDAAFRRSVQRSLRARGFQVAEYGSVGQLLLEGIGRAPGCLVLDIHLPGPSGLDLQQMMAMEAEPLPMIFVTAEATAHETLRAMKAGAVDFLFKPVDTEALLAAVHQAVDDHASRRDSQRRLVSLRNRYSRLSAREREVLDMVVMGALNKQIGWKLGAAERTVKAHRAHIMEKMEVNSLAELVRVTSQLNLPPAGRNVANG
jgi:FixJ family two-component response regulator